MEDAKITKDDLVAWACIRLDRLQQGYRFIHLFDVKGNVTPGMLLVKIEKTLRLESQAAVVPLASPASPPIKETSPPASAKGANIVVPVPALPVAEPSKAQDSELGEQVKSQPREGVEPGKVAEELKAAQAVDPAAIPLPASTPTPTPTPSAPTGQGTTESTVTKTMTPDTPALAVASPVPEVTTK